MHELTEESPATGALVLAAHPDKLVLPRYARREARQLDEISERQNAPVIIAGFGRYGRIVGRMLAAQGISATVLDHDTPT